MIIHFPCFNATIVLGSRGSVSSSSCGTIFCPGGRREVEIRAIIWRGGERAVGIVDVIIYGKINKIG